MKEIGLVTLIKKILFLIIFPSIGMKKEEQNIDYSTEIFSNKINELLDNFAPFKRKNQQVQIKI